MKINLRKAAAIQTEIRKAIVAKNSVVTGKVSMPLWNVNDEQLAMERGRQMSALGDVERLESILVDIREQVGKANVKSKISDLLAEQVAVSSQVGRLSRLLENAEPMPSSDALERQASAAREANEKNAYRMQDNLTVSCFSQPDLDKFKNNLLKLRRRGVEINDQLIAANLSNEIAISDNNWAWLETNGIV